MTFELATVGLQHYSVHGHTLSEVAAVVGAHTNSKGQHEAGEAHLQPEWHYHADEGHTITSVSITLNCTITLPDWVDSAASGPNVKAEWDRFKQALYDHEVGHWSTTGNLLQGLDDRMVGMSKSDAEALWADTVKMMDDANVAYDQATDHGRNTGTVVNLDVTDS
jgi:predicted secreted Zn-dependent protease